MPPPLTFESFSVLEFFHHRWVGFHCWKRYSFQDFCQMTCSYLFQCHQFLTFIFIVRQYTLGISFSSAESMISFQTLCFVQLYTEKFILRQKHHPIKFLKFLLKNFKNFSAEKEVIFPSCMKIHPLECVKCVKIINLQTLLPSLWLKKLRN